MFEIMYRITDINYVKSLDKEMFNNSSDIEGFISLNFNEKIYGHCHYHPLGNNEGEWDLLTNWFDSLLNALITLRLSSYVAISDIESPIHWLEFKKEAQAIIVSILKSEKESSSYYFSTIPLQNYKYGNWNNISINFSNFENEIILKSKQYLYEIATLNYELLESKRIKSLKELISKVTNK